MTEEQLGMPTDKQEFILEVLRVYLQDVQLMQKLYIDKSITDSQFLIHQSKQIQVLKEHYESIR